MDKEFWLEKWKKNETNFNQSEVNPYLKKHANIFGTLEGKKIFIPLCGKSIDIAWFLTQGAEVIGVELSSIAIESFLSEHNLTYTKTQKTNSIIYQSQSLKFICGDLFQLEKNDVGAIDWIYDRASFIALDPITRAKYAHKLFLLSSANTKIMLITLFYTNPEPKGPPYAIPDAEVHALFSKNFHIQTLSENENKDIMPHLIQRGLIDLKDRVYLLEASNHGVS